MAKRSARTDLTGLLDVILIVVLAMVVARTQSVASAADDHVTELQASVVSTATIAVNAALDVSTREQASATPELPPTQPPTEQQTTSPLDRRIDTAVHALIRDVDLTIWVVSRDQVVRYRRYGEPWQYLATAATAATESGETALLDQLAQQAPDSVSADGIWLFVADPEAEPLYWAATALRQEIAATSAIRAFFPPTATPL